MFTQGLAERAKPRFEAASGGALDEKAFKSDMLAALAARALLRLSEEESLDCVLPVGTGVGAMRLGPIRDGAFAVHLFCGFADDVRHEARFPSDRIDGACRAAEPLLDPHAPPTLPGASAGREAELKHRLLAGCVPHVRFHFAGGGRPWTKMMTGAFRAGHPAPAYEHYDADRLLHLLDRQEEVTTSIRLAGRSAVDEMERGRVVLGRMSACDLARLVEAHGRELVERDVSHFLDPDSDRTHEAICRTLESPTESLNFFFYNRGVTFGCDRFLGAQRLEDREFRVENLRVLDGLKTCRAVHDAVARRGNWSPNAAFVMVRLYEIPYADRAGLIPDDKPSLTSFMPSN